MSNLNPKPVDPTPTKPKFTFEASEALQQFMAEVHEPSLDFTNPNDIGTAAESLLTKLAEVPTPTELTPEEVMAGADAQLKRDFCGILKALQDDTRSSGEKRTIITNALARYS